MVDSKLSGAEHKLILNNQEQMLITGVSRVESFNPEEILLDTSHGLLHIKGDGLDMRNLNLEQGVVEIVGLITETRYSGARTTGRRSILEKIFK
ncbi:MAG TPA: sporulation protein YabP [Bacillota bacterium]|nr:sporulation protein YabP [Bacillota bacterium]HUM59806.1 sporulation protein YabP [Bacillota bacterium]